MPIMQIRPVLLFMMLAIPPSHLDGEANLIQGSAHQFIRDAAPQVSIHHISALSKLPCIHSTSLLRLHQWWLQARLGRCCKGGCAGPAEVACPSRSLLYHPGTLWRLWHGWLT